VTGSTQAGMIAGFALQDRPRRVLGIDGSATVRPTWEQVARIARRTAEAIGLDAPSPTPRSSSSTSGMPGRTGFRM
jgi:1-aminocyclopropane-1-carboxylate deaminase